MPKTKTSAKPSKPQQSEKVKVEPVDVLSLARKVESAAAQVVAAIREADAAVRTRVQQVGADPGKHSGIVSRYVLTRVAGRLGWPHPAKPVPSLTASVAGIVRDDGYRPRGAVAEAAAAARLADAKRGRSATTDGSPADRAAARVEATTAALLDAVTACDRAVRSHPRYDARSAGVVVRTVRNRLAPILGGQLPTGKGPALAEAVEAMASA